MTTRKRRKGNRSVPPPRHQKITALQHRVEHSGQPGRIDGLTDACIDCAADGTLVLLPGGYVIAEIHHDHGCPAAAGVTEWKPAP